MNFFSNALVGQFVVLGFLLLVTLRPLLKKSQNMESVAFLAAIAFVFNILLVFIFGLSVLLLITLFLCSVVLVTNIASIYRLSQGLYSDRHSTPFRVSSYIEAFVIVVCMVVSIVFSPTSFNVDLQKKEVYTGSFSRGFFQKEGLLEKTSLIVTEYSLNNTSLRAEEISNQKDTVVIYISPVGIAASDSALRFTTAAEMGLTVITGDFFVLDSPKTGTQLDSAINANPILAPYILHFLPALTKEQQNSFLNQKELELEALLMIVGQKYSSAVILAEGESVQLAMEAHRKYPNFIVDVLSNSGDTKADDYYEKGLGDFTELNPFDARLSKFASTKEYNDFRTYAKEESPHLRYARGLFENLEKLAQER